VVLSDDSQHAAPFALVPVALVEEMLGALREEVKEMDRTNWLYEVQDPSVTMRISV